MKEIQFDIETYSPVDLKKHGVYRYAAHPDFRVLIIAYSVDSKASVLLNPAKGDLLPAAVSDAIRDPHIAKYARNANFERVCMSAYFGLRPGTYLNSQNWHCTMAQSRYCGLPGGLEGVAEALNLPETERKLGTGKALIKKFCKPDKNGMQPTYDFTSKEWRDFEYYCLVDVLVDSRIRSLLPPLPATIQEEYELDQLVNDRGIPVDGQLLHQCQAACAEVVPIILQKLRVLTELDNPNSHKQFKEWTAKMTGNPHFETATIEEIRGVASELPTIVQEALALKKIIGKTSLAKFDAIERYRLEETGRIHGTIVFYGANRTGRYAGAGLQPQNLPSKDRPEETDELQQYLKSLGWGALGSTLTTLFDPLTLPAMISHLVRPTLSCEATGKTFIISDSTAIEARVVAWAAMETWRMKTFAQNGDIYKASASAMFDIPIDQIDRPLRAKGKIAELALGYQGGHKALMRMGALEMGLKEAELPSLVDSWREANPAIVGFWKRLEQSARAAVVNPGTKVSAPANLTFYVDPLGSLRITLPSKRELVYAGICLAEVEKGRGLQLAYKGLNERHQWVLISTYGGKLAENVTQAIARDILVHKMLHLERAGWKVVLHVHDEVVVEVDDAGDYLASGGPLIHSIMVTPIPWTTIDPYTGVVFRDAGIPLNAETMISKFYMK